MISFLDSVIRAAVVTCTVCIVLLLFVLWTEHAYNRGVEVATYECNAE